MTRAHCSRTRWVFLIVGTPEKCLLLGPFLQHLDKLIALNTPECLQPPVQYKSSMESVMIPELFGSTSRRWSRRKTGSG